MEILIQTENFKDKKMGRTGLAMLKSQIYHNTLIRKQTPSWAKKWLNQLKKYHTKVHQIKGRRDMIMIYFYSLQIRRPPTAVHQNCRVEFVLTEFTSRLFSRHSNPISQRWTHFVWIHDSKTERYPHETRNASQISHSSATLAPHLGP